MLKVFIFLSKYIWLVIALSAMAGNETVPAPGPWTLSVLGQVYANLDSTQIQPEVIPPQSPSLPINSWMKKLPVISKDGLLKASMTKNQPQKRVNREKTFSHIQYKTLRGITSLAFDKNDHSRYAELLVSKHETAILNMTCALSNENDSPPNSQIACPLNPTYQPLTTKLESTINKLDAILENHPPAKFSSWRPFSDVIRLYTTAIGYTHITYYQTITDQLVPLATVAYSGPDTLTFSLFPSPIHTTKEHPAATVEIVAFIENLPVYEQSEDRSHLSPERLHGTERRHKFLHKLAETTPASVRSPLLFSEPTSVHAVPNSLPGSPYAVPLFMPNTPRFTPLSQFSESPFPNGQIFRTPASAGLQSISEQSDSPESKQSTPASVVRAQILAIRKLLYGSDYIALQSPLYRNAHSAASTAITPVRHKNLWRPHRLSASSRSIPESVQSELLDLLTDPRALQNNWQQESVSRSLFSSTTDDSSGTSYSSSLTISSSNTSDDQENRPLDINYDQIALQLENEEPTISPPLIADTVPRAGRRLLFSSPSQSDQSRKPLRDLQDR